jgi:hypothetical protein
MERWLRRRDQSVARSTAERQSSPQCDSTRASRACATRRADRRRCTISCSTRRQADRLTFQVGEHPRRLDTRGEYRQRRKIIQNGSRTWKPSDMPAPVKLTARRERRLLALIAAGATLAEASRATQISRQAVNRHARTDAIFADRLRRARDQVRPSRLDPASAHDWREIAAKLERQDPLRWALPDQSFEFDVTP